MPPRHTALTEKSRAFLREYLKDFDASKAAIRAGYSPRSARFTACKMLQKPDIAAELKRMTDKATNRAEVTVDRILQELTLVAFMNGDAVFPKIVDGKIQQPDITKMTDDQKRTVQEVAITKQGIKVGRYDKLRALEMLGRYLAMFTDRHEVAGDPAAPLVIVQPKKAT